MPRRCLHGVHLRCAPGAACTPVFASALPARGASVLVGVGLLIGRLCLGAACTGCIHEDSTPTALRTSLPRRCLHGVHRRTRWSGTRWTGLCLGAACTGCIQMFPVAGKAGNLCLGAACTGCIPGQDSLNKHHPSLPRRCLHGVHPEVAFSYFPSVCFASALPARGASKITRVRWASPSFASALPARGASWGWRY